jgi:hypothetical protein
MPGISSDFKEGVVRFVSWTEMTQHPLYALLEHALTFPYDYNKKCSPQTRDGRHVSVAAIYNISRWGTGSHLALGRMNVRYLS